MVGERVLLLRMMVVVGTETMGAGVVVVVAGWVVLMLAVVLRVRCAGPLVVLPHLILM